MKKWIAAFLLLSFLFAGCGAPQAAPTQAQPTELPPPTATPSPLPEPTQAEPTEPPPTSTSPAPPTETAPEPVLFLDEFEGGIDSAWTWVNQDPQRWSVTEEGWLAIQATNPGLLAEGGEVNQANLLVQPAPEGDFMITTRLYAAPDENFQQAGIFLIHDGTNYVSALNAFCAFCLPDTGGYGFFLESFINGEYVSNGMILGHDETVTDVYLRLSYDAANSTVTGFAASQEGQWQEIGRIEGLPPIQQVGLGAANVPSPEGIQEDLLAQYAYFEVSRGDTPLRTADALPLPPEASPDAAADSESLVDAKGVEMALIPAGSFEMGGDADAGLSECQKLFEPFIDKTCDRAVFENEEPVHTVTLEAFYMDRYEVTNARYAACVTAGACDPPDNSSSYTNGSYYGAPQFDDYPVMYVSWTDAGAYCQWRGARLPTEAEWEMAARGGKGGQLYPWGDSFDGSKGNFCDKSCPLDRANPDFDDGYADTAPVGSYEPNGFGLYDMVGNVWEWVSSLYLPYPYDPNDGRENPGGEGERVLRGGAWLSFGSYLQPAFRDYYPPDKADFYLGFRCALSAAAP